MTTYTTLDGVLLSLLTGSSALRAYTTAIYAGILPDACTFPAVTIFRISSPYSRVVEAPRFQISAWSTSLLQAKQISKTIEGILDGYSGLVGSWEIVRIIPIQATDLPRDDSTGLFQVVYDFQVISKK
jgi:hypothetical protein